MLNSSQRNVNKPGSYIGWVEKFRRFIDGDNGEDEVEAVLREVAPRRPRDRFYQELARQIDKVVNEQAFNAPNVPLTVPAEIVIRLAPDVDADWQGPYRRRLIDGLEAAITERVRDMAGTWGDRTVPPRIKIERDDSLDIGGFKTETRIAGNVVAVAASTDPEATIVYLESTDDEPTIVITAEVPLYEIEVFLNGRLIQRVPVAKARATIGRGSKAKPVDVPLTDPGVSREHAVLDLEEGKLWLTALGRNRTMLAGKPLERRHRRQVHHGENIEICGFTLRVAQLSEAGKRN